MTFFGELLGLGRDIAKAADVPDDVDQARAIKHTSRQLGRALRRLQGKGLSPSARIVVETEAWGCRAALRRLGVDEGEIRKATDREG